MKYGIVVFPGSNCEQDSYHAVKHLGNDAEIIWHQDQKIANYDCIILPGGFSYGDYLRAGAIARFSPVMKEIIKFALSGGLVLGICNGFQILLEANLLPGGMIQNRDIHFICKPVFVKTCNSNTPFTSELKDDEILNIPINHMSGNYFCDDSTLKTLNENDQILFRYSDSQGNISDEVNPNGSKENIAGICNKKMNVFGFMPHPERAVESVIGSEDGKGIFESIKNYISKSSGNK